MVTLKDVAQAANVSKSTVSAVLTNRAAELGIKEETCRRVRDAAAQLRYRKNEIAAQMKSNRPNMIALFIPAVDLGELAFRFLLGAGNEAEKFNCYLKNIIFQARSRGIPQTARLHARSMPGGSAGNRRPRRSAAAAVESDGGVQCAAGLHELRSIPVRPFRPVR